MRKPFLIFAMYLEGVGLFSCVSRGATEMKYRIEVTSGSRLFRHAWKSQEEIAGQTIHISAFDYIL